MDKMQTLDCMMHMTIGTVVVIEHHEREDYTKEKIKKSSQHLITLQ
jgi:hypothetical protein